MSVVCYKHLRINFDTKKITVYSIEKKLDAKAWQTLEYLFSNRSRVVGSDELIETIWDHRPVSNDVLISAIYRIRKAIDQNEESLIRTVYKVGYQFNHCWTESKEALDDDNSNDFKHSSLKQILLSIVKRLQNWLS